MYMFQVHNDSDSSVQPIDRYCQECDIRFSNLKTFKAHKQHYCSTRNVIKRAPNANSSPSPNLSIDSRITPPLSFALASQNPPQPFIALPTNPVLIVPCSLIQAGNMLSSPVTSGLTAQDGVYLLLPDGTIQMVAQGMTNQASRVPEMSSPVLQPILISNNQVSIRFALLRCEGEKMRFFFRVGYILFSQRKVSRSRRKCQILFIPVKKIPYALSCL